MALNFYIFEFGMRKPTILCVRQRLCRYLNVFVIALYNYVDFCHSEIMDICISMSHFSLWFLFIVHTLDFKINEKGAFKEFFLHLSLASKDTWSIWSVSSSSNTTYIVFWLQNHFWLCSALLLSFQRLCCSSFFFPYKFHTGLWPNAMHFACTWCIQNEVGV